jgi:hypothetical protein
MSRAAAPPPPSAPAGGIEDYLVSLRQALADLSDADEAVDEVEGHLHDLRDELTASGLDVGRAEQLAVERFGSPGMIASGHRSLVLPAGYELGLVAAIAMCALGLGGLVSLLVHSATGQPSSLVPVACVLVGVAGTAVAEFLWLRRDGRTLRPDRPVLHAGTITLAVVGVILVGLALPVSGDLLPLGASALAAAAVSRRLNSVP